MVVTTFILMDSYHINSHTMADVLLVHIVGVWNPSDVLTKSLGWIIHHRQCHRVMGMAGSPYYNTIGRLGLLSPFAKSQPWYPML
jgi:hypothetical protein